MIERANERGRNGEGERERGGRERERERGLGQGRGRGRGSGGGGELWVFRSFLDFIDGWMGGCGMNKEGFLILLELCRVYFAFKYAAIFDPAVGFQVRRLLVVTDGGWWMDGFQNGSLIMPKILSNEVHSI